MLLTEIKNEKLPSVKTLSVAELAKLHNVTVASIDKQVRAGIKVEYEHTKDKATAREIALDHLKEDPKYYVPHLKDMEKKFANKED